MEGLKLPVSLFNAELFKGGVFGGGGKGKIRGIAPHFSFGHGFEDFVLGVRHLIFAAPFLLPCTAHGPVHIVMGRTALGAVGLVNDHGKVFPAQITDPVQDKGKFLNGCDDHLFALFQGRF